MAQPSITSVLEKSKAKRITAGAFSEQYNYDPFTGSLVPLMKHKTEAERPATSVARTKTQSMFGKRSQTAMTASRPRITQTQLLL